MLPSPRDVFLDTPSAIERDSWCLCAVLENISVAGDENTQTECTAAWSLEHSLYFQLENNCQFQKRPAMAERNTLFNMQKSG